MNTIKFLGVLVCACVSVALSGTVYPDSAVDFRHTDIHGTEHHLFSYLESNRWVLLDFTAQS